MRYEEEIHNYVQSHKDEIINMLKELVKIPSFQSAAEEGAPFGRACAEVLEYVKSCWQKNGFDTELHQDGGYLLSYYGEGEKSIGLFSHADVVSVSDDWIFTKPFEPIEKDGFLIGRGVVDDKAGIVTALYCAKMLKELNIPFNSKLVMFVGANEETGMRDIKNYVKENTPPDFSLVTDCAFPIFRGDKGILQFEAVCETELLDVDCFFGGEDINITLGEASAKIGDNIITAEGISCHGALPKGSVNAGYLLAERLLKEFKLCENDKKIITFVSKLLKAYDGGVFGIENEDKTFGMLTCTNGVIKNRNGKLVITFDIRYGTAVDYEKMKQKINTFFIENGWTTQIISEKKPFLISEDNSYLKKCLKAYSQITGTENPQTYINAGATHAGELPCAVEVGNDLYGGAPKDMPKGHGNAHQPDECLNIEGFLKGMEIIMNMLLECDRD